MDSGGNSSDRGCNEASFSGGEEGGVSGFSAGFGPGGHIGKCLPPPKLSVGVGLRLSSVKVGVVDRVWVVGIGLGSTIVDIEAVVSRSNQNHQVILDVYPSSSCM